MNIGQERAEFEVWYMREFEVYPRRNESGGFKSQYVNTMFKSWKAGRAALLIERDALREALEMMVEMVEMNGWGRDYAMDVARAAINHARRAREGG